MLPLDGVTGMWRRGPAAVCGFLLEVHSASIPQSSTTCFSSLSALPCSPALEPWVNTLENFWWVAGDWEPPGHLLFWQTAGLLSRVELAQRIRIFHGSGPNRGRKEIEERKGARFSQVLSHCCISFSLFPSDNPPVVAVNPYLSELIMKTQKGLFSSSLHIWIHISVTV